MTLEHSGNDSPHSLPVSCEQDDVKAFGTVQKSRKYLGIVAVSAGEGFAETFTSMGVDVLVSGGQSMNPSAQDFIDAFRQLDADNIIVFPNNKNIILSARQAVQPMTIHDPGTENTFGERSPGWGPDSGRRS